MKRIFQFVSDVRLKKSRKCPSGAQDRAKQMAYKNNSFEKQDIYIYGTDGRTIGY